MARRVREIRCVAIRPDQHVHRPTQSFVRCPPDRRGPFESSVGAPMTFDPIAVASCDRGTAATRAITPLGSIMNIDRSRGSMKSSESPKNAVSAPADGPYEFAPPLTDRR